MKATDLIEKLRKELETFRSRGLSVVSIEDLGDFLNAAETAAKQLSAQADQEFEMQKLRVSLIGEATLEQFRSVLEAGGAALKVLLTMNGGAAVALLAFLGSLEGKGAHTAVTPFAAAMLAFIWGVFGVGLSSAARYVTQVCGTGANRWYRTGYGFMGLSIFAGLGSLGAFITGGIMAYRAFVAGAA